MKNKIFKYRIIGIVIFLFQLFLFLFFCYGTYDSFLNVSLGRIFSTENYIFLFVLCIFISTFLGLICLSFKSKKSILYLNINYILILLFFVSGWIKLLIEKSFEKDDIVKLIVVLSVLSVFLLITNVFKIKKVQFSELDNIGKHKD